VGGRAQGCAERFLRPARDAHLPIADGPLPALPGGDRGGGALAAKPMEITLPVLFLLLDLWPLRRFADGPTELGSALLEKLPWALLAAGTALATLGAQVAAGALAAPAELGLLPRLANAALAIVRYLELTSARPSSALYPHPGCRAVCVRRRGCGCRRFGGGGSVLLGSPAVARLRSVGSGLVALLTLGCCSRRAGARRPLHLPAAPRALPGPGWGWRTCSRGRPDPSSMARPGAGSASASPCRRCAWRTSS
jgi:hypothetical protein